MTVLCIQHKTTYQYHRPVSLGPHRLMLRPRESRDIRVVSISIATTPPASIRWTSDVFGNAIATASFQESADSLKIESSVHLEHHGDPWPVFDIAAPAISFPFSYSDAESTDLGALTRPQFPDANGRLTGWARGFVLGERTDTLSLLKDLNAGVSAWVSYQTRDDEGTQSPIESLDRGWGSCRDIAVLMIEAARSLGFGARIVSGYLYRPVPDGGLPGGGAASDATHAWAEIYLPGAGWVTFDPTNRTVGTSSLIPVAVARDIRQAIPVSGSFVGRPGDFAGMTVEVSVVGLDGAAPG